MCIEMLAVLALGFVPESAPVQISQVVINFIASMQYNTFRQAQGIPVATTFATNHIRQIGIGLAKELRHRHSSYKSHREKLAKHAQMLFFFAMGAVVGAACCHFFIGKAIWATAIPLGIIFATLLHADLTTEKNMVDQKPAGHWHTGKTNRTNALSLHCSSDRAFAFARYIALFTFQRARVVTASTEDCA